MSEATTDKFKRCEGNPGALTSIDTTGLEAYKLRKRLMKEKNSRIESLEERINMLEQLILNAGIK